MWKVSFRNDKKVVLCECGNQTCMEIFLLRPAIEEMRRGRRAYHFVLVLVSARETFSFGFLCHLACVPAGSVSLSQVFFAFNVDDAQDGDGAGVFLTLGRLCSLNRNCSDVTAKKEATRLRLRLVRAEDYCNPRVRRTDCPSWREPLCPCPRLDPHDRLSLHALSKLDNDLCADAWIFECSKCGCRKTSR